MGRRNPAGIRYDPSKTAAPCVLATMLTTISEQNVTTYPYDFGFFPAKRDDMYP